MRQKLTRQMSIFSVTMRHDIGKELAAFSEILDASPKMLDLVYADLTRVARKDTGREGMTAEQVLRCVALKQYRNLSYEELAFHLEDSKSFRAYGAVSIVVISSGEHQVAFRGDLGGNSHLPHAVCRGSRHRNRS